MLGRTSNCSDSNGAGVNPFGASNGGVAKEKKRAATGAAARTRTKAAGGGGGRSGLGDCCG